MEVLSRASPHDPVVIEEGVGCARTAVAVHPDKAFSHYVLAVAYHLFKNDRAASEPHYRKALELNPRFTFCMMNLGNILYDERRCRRRGQDVPAGRSRPTRSSCGLA